MSSFLAPNGAERWVSETSSKIKISSLYNIIKNDDVSTLTNFFFENPGYNEENHLTTGKKLKMLEQAIASDAMQCFIFLLNRINFIDLRKYVLPVISHYKKNNAMYEHFYTIVKMLSDKENNSIVLFDILQTFIMLNIFVSNEFLDKLLSSFNLLEYLQEENQKHRFECELIKGKLAWIIYFEKYYRENNIDTKTFFAKTLLYYRTENKNNLIKIFKNIDFTQKVFIEDVSRLGFNYKTKKEYSIEFIIAIVCEYKNYKNFNIFKERTIEDEFFKMIEEKHVFIHNEHMFYLILDFLKNQSYCHKCLFRDDFKDLFENKYLPYFSQKFIDYLKDIFILNKHNKKIHYKAEVSEYYTHLNNLFLSYQKEDK